MIAYDDLGHLNVIFGKGTVGITAGHEIESGKPCLFLHQIGQNEDTRAYVGINSELLPAGTIRLQFNGTEAALAVIRQILYAFKNSKGVNIAELNGLLKAVGAECTPTY